jgi:hypothetical protein
MTDDAVRKLRNDDEHRDRPTTNHPLNGPKRPTWKPLIYLVLILAALVLIYLVGLAVLVPSG